MIKKLACIADKSSQAESLREHLDKKYNFVGLQEAEAIVVLGGDGFMLHTLHDNINLLKPFYGINCGTVGFLMNEERDEDLLQRINSAKIESLNPLEMLAEDCSGNKYQAMAINEVSLLRETRQAAKIKIDIDGKTRIENLVGDGVLVATPAGSTAYNFSVNGPIIPFEAHILALTPISPFRPRRWNGALLPRKHKIKFEILNPNKRPVSAVADFIEIRDVKTVEVRSKNKEIKMLFDRGHSLEERILSEQFAV